MRRFDEPVQKNPLPAKAELLPRPQIRKERPSTIRERSASACNLQFSHLGRFGYQVQGGLETARKRTDRVQLRPNSLENLPTLAKRSASQDGVQGLLRQHVKNSILGKAQKDPMGAYLVNTC